MAVTAMAIPTLEEDVAAPHKPPPTPPTTQPFLPVPVFPLLASANTIHFQKAPPPAEEEKSINSEMTEMTLRDGGNRSPGFWFDNTITKVKRLLRPKGPSLSSFSQSVFFFFFLILFSRYFNCFFSAQLSFSWKEVNNYRQCFFHRWFFKMFFI